MASEKAIEAALNAFWDVDGPDEYRMRAAFDAAAAVDGDARGNSALKFSVGEHVRKPSGYAFDGIVRSAFMVAGGDRYVVESEASPGLLHIFNGSQLERKS